MRRRMSTIAMSTAAVIALGGLMPAPASAAVATSTWTGLGADGNWTTAANWDTVPSAGSNLVFPDIADSARHAGVNTFAAGTSFGSITVGESGYALSGNALVSTGGLNAAYGAGTSTLSAPLSMSAPGAVAVQAGGTLAITGAVSGSSGIAKTGGGLALLNAANSYLGVTAISAGTLAIGNSSALGSTANGNGTDVASGATLEVRGTINTSEPIRIVGNGVGGVGSLFNGTGNNVVQSVTMTGSSSIGTAAGTFLLIPSTLAQSGGAARMTKVGTGTLDVLATASYTGGTAVTSGTLAVEGTVSGTIDVAAGANVSGAGGNLGNVTSVGGTVTAGFATSPFTSDATSVTLDADSTFQAQINGTAAGNGSTGHSRLIVAQGVTLAGAKLALTMSGYTPAVGDALTIVQTGTTLTGTFQGLPEGAYVTAPGGAGRTFRISYQGDDGNDIVLTSVADSTTTLSSTPNPSTPGASVTLSAVVSPTGATGTVTFKDGANTLGAAPVTNGTATLSTTTLSTGSHSITASYGGSATVAPSTSTAVTQTVTSPPPDTMIMFGPSSDSAGNSPTASFGFISPDQGGASFECSLDAAAYEACTSPKDYTGLAGGTHTFAVRAVNSNGTDPTPATRTWGVTGVFAVTGSVSVTGSPKVGQTLEASSTVTTSPAARSTTREWLRDGTPIDGATGTTYELTNDDVSAEISYQETRTRADYTTTVATSAPTASITGGVITLGAPTVSGNAVVDQVLTATPGTVSPASAAVTLAWSVDGVPNGATGTTYTVKPGDVGKAILVTATATKVDYDPASTASALTSNVQKAVFSTGVTATISGAFKVGEELTANAGAVAPAPDSYTYQWFAGDAVISGATARTFTLAKAQKNATISVKVTAVRAGYVDASGTSDASAKVVTNAAPDLELSPSAAKVRLGEATTLSWTSGDAATVVASGSWSGVKAASGSETVTPAATGTQTYTLTATNESGSTVAQIAVEVALPAATLKLKARKTVKAGRKITVSTKGLAPGEAYTIRIGGKLVASGKATSKGKVKRSVRVSASTAAGKRLFRVTGSVADRTGTVRVKVTKNTAPSVALRDASVRASEDQRITVSKLRPRELVSVTYKGERISPKTARANAKGVYTLTFDVGIDWGRETVTAKGFTSGRSSSAQFTVTNRCPQGGYYCR